MKYRGIYKITGLMAVVIMVLTTVIGPVLYWQDDQSRRGRRSCRSCRGHKGCKCCRSYSGYKGCKFHRSCRNYRQYKSRKCFSSDRYHRCCPINRIEKSDIAANEAETATSGPDIETPSAILMEAATGQVIYEKIHQSSLRLPA